MKQFVNIPTAVNLASQSPTGMMRDMMMGMMTMCCRLSRG